MMAKSSEDVLLVISHVKNKKCEGTLYMMSERMAWMPATKETFTISHSYIDIKTQKISPDGKDKVQLQVVLQQGGASTFHFANSQGRDAQVAERDSVKELLQQLLPRFRDKVSTEVEEKKRVLQEDPVLYQLYKDLVLGQVISPEEFWANRMTKSKTTDSSRQEIGISAAFLADIKPKVDGCNGLRYDITPEIIESVFRTYPTVRQKHLENVPDKMSEEEFWKRFFQSHYFHRDRFNFTNKDLFAECAKKDEQMIQSEIQKVPNDFMLDLASMSDISFGEGYNADADDNKLGSNPANASLIKRFNQHSTMVLKSCDKRQSLATNSASDHQHTDGVVNGNTRITMPSASKSSASDSNGVEASNNKKAKVREKIEYDDLEAGDSTATVSAPALKLARVDSYLHGPTPVIAMQYSTSEDMIQACQAFTHHMMAWQPNLTQVMPSAAAVNVLWELSPGGALMQNCTQQQLQQIVSVELQQEMRNLYIALGELLRHFWTCFPTTNKTLEDKVLRMYDALQRFHKQKLVPFNEKIARQHFAFNLVSHMESLLEAAHTKFTTWQQKRSQAALPRRVT